MFFICVLLFSKLLYAIATIRRSEPILSDMPTTCADSANAAVNLSLLFIKYFLPAERTVLLVCGILRGPIVVALLHECGIRTLA
jgi:hypothetical protein